MKPIVITISVLAGLWIFAPLLPFIAAVSMFILWIVLFGSLFLN